MSSSADYEPAFPPPPQKRPGKPRPAFPPPPPPPVTPATRAFPPPEQPATVRFGEHVLRDDRAGAAPSARFDVDLSERETLPPDLVARMRAEAEAVGYAAGWAQGRREAQASAAAEAERMATEAAEVAEMHRRRVDRALKALGAAAEALEHRAVPAAHDIEAQIVESAFALAEAVLGRELRTAAEPGREALTRALALAPAASPVTVRLNPADRLTIGRTELVMDGRTVTLVEDPALQPGDAVAVCEATTIDARLGPALERVREVLEQ
ncbi:flagellar assembly protein FliH [Dactylosporangium fulvum]|uniref:Flagellar assembly protein FliH n=1 Tax=Dactylosporangium fulvum TaxID=53359 RepID=A0ABY5VUS9_9ACTN|nr:flagellar assembly protein FliH [Dactylosporangium fulvum]UWP81513.1 flagellar assembly protein FliH [Dactylosporangium fulvum]